MFLCFLQEETFEMEIFKLKTELDSSQVTNTSLKDTITLKENDIQVLHERIIDVRLNFIDQFLYIYFFFFISMKQK